MFAKTASLLLWALALTSPLTAQTKGCWQKAFIDLSTQDRADAHGYANVGFTPAIMSIPDKPFTATRVYTDQRKENGSNVGSPISAQGTIARDEKGRIHFEMPFESQESDKLVIGGFDIQTYDPVAHTLIRYFARADHSLPPEPVAEVRTLSRTPGSSPLIGNCVQRPSPDPVDPQAGHTSDSDNLVASEAESKFKAGSTNFSPKEEDLPSQSIDGVTVFGHRWIYKYGAQQESFLIQESWLSPAYGIDMRVTVLRENSGAETSEAHDIVPGPADPTLFTVSPGYITHFEY